MKIGPGRNSKSPSRWFQIDEPVTSDGMRSGVNWMRVKRMLSTCANERAASVFARPGKSSSRTWPSARKPSRTSSSGVALADDGPLDLVEHLRPRARLTCASSIRSPSSASTTRRELARRDAPREPVLGRRPIGADELPGLVAEDRARRVRAPRQRDAAARAEQPGGERAQARDEPVVEVERAGDAERGLVLDAVEARRAAASRGSCRRLAQRALVGIGAPERQQTGRRDRGADDERVDADAELEPPGREERDREEGDRGQRRAAARAAEVALPHERCSGRRRAGVELAPASPRAVAARPAPARARRSPPPSSRCPRRAART